MHSRITNSDSLSIHTRSLLIVLIQLSLSMFSMKVLLMTLYAPSSGSLSCMDEENRPSEWFVLFSVVTYIIYRLIIYKRPSSADYFYMDPQKMTWELSRNKINLGGMVKNTYDSIFKLKNQDNSFYGIYNDELFKSVLTSVPLQEPGMWWGHMKGAVAFDSSDTGLWVIHSIPKLPASENSFVYPENGYTYAQHFLCLTLSRRYINETIKQLSISRPLFEQTYLSNEYAREFPSLFLLLNNKKITNESDSVVNMTSSGEALKLKHFSKARHYHKDLYSDIVAPAINNSLAVETWQHRAELPSECNSNFSVKNIKSLKFKPFDVDLLTMQDHSKWAVTTPVNLGASEAEKWVCLGDINRQIAQLHRGGGTMCINNEKLWKAFHDLVKEVEPCHVDFLQHFVGFLNSIMNFSY